MRKPARLFLFAFALTLCSATAFAQSHSATVSWTPVQQPGGVTIASWNVLRGTTSDGPYAQLASVPGSANSYSDSTVSSGSNYYYVVQSVDTQGVASANSTQVEAVVPNSDPPLAVSTSSLPPATVGVSYSVTITASGGVGPYTWSGTTAGGLSLSATGLLSGTPPTAGTFNELVTVKDSTGATASASLPLTVTTGGGGGAGGDPPSLAFVQVSSAVPQQGAQVTATFAKAQAAGDLNLVAVGWNDATAHVTSVTDSMGNPYILAVGPTVQSGTATQAIYYAKNIFAAPANGNTITVAFNTAAKYPDLRIAEYSGIDTTNPLDVVSAAQGTGTLSNSGSVTTTNANDLLVGASLVQDQTRGPGAGYTSRVLTSPDGDILEDEIVTTAGSYNATAQLNGNAWIMQMVAFRAAGSAAGTAPTITSVKSTAFMMGASGTFTVTTTGSPTPSLSESGALPAGVTFTDNGNGTATLAGTPASGSNGAYSLTFTANNGMGAPQTQSFTLTVNQSPTFSSSNSTTFTMGTAGRFSVTTSGVPTPSLSESGALPAGVTFTDNGNGTATLAGTPASGSNGAYSLTFTANNGMGAPQTQSFTLTVNQSPTFSSSNSTTFTMGTAGRFSVTTSGVPTPSLSESGALPAGVTFTDNGNGTATLAGTPASGTARVYSLTFTANNGMGTPTSQTFTLTVASGSTSGSSIAFVQVSSAVPQQGAQVTATFAKAQAAGDLNVVAVGWNDATANVTSVTDSMGNPYTLAVGPTVQNGTATQAIYYAKNIFAAPANGNTITVVFNTVAKYPDLRVTEYSGIDPTNPLDVVSAAQGSGTLSNSGSVTTTNANDLLVGASLVQDQTRGPGAGYTSRVLTSPDGDILEDEIVTTTGSRAATAQLNGNAWIMQMVAFRAAGSNP